MNEEKLIISASRTKDLVRVSPGRLAAVLMGEAPVRFGLGKNRAALPLDDLGALVIWTKDPAHMLTDSRLRRALNSFLDRTGGVIVLNLTVTGLAETVLEPGIPVPETVRKTVADLIDCGLAAPELIILRYDPLIQVRTDGGHTIGNLSLDTFNRVLKLFSPLGVRRIKTSLVDIRYAHVPDRLGRTGLTVDLPGDTELDRLLDEMRSSARRAGARLDICCHPETGVSNNTAGCIDGFMINQALAGRPWRVTTRRHNDIGRQRRTCRCSFSRDIGYSAGFQTCFKNHGACLYCYSQKNTTGLAITKAAELTGTLNRQRPGAGKSRPDD
jgi:hypothetical protein